jgi:hypothetical protein
LSTSRLFLQLQCRTTALVLYNAGSNAMCKESNYATTQTPKTQPQFASTIKLRSTSLKALHRNYTNTGNNLEKEHAQNDKGSDGTHELREQYERKEQDVGGNTNMCRKMAAEGSPHSRDRSGERNVIFMDFCF